MIKTEHIALCREFWIGYGGEGDVKAHMETKMYKTGRRQISTSKSIGSFLVSWEKYQNGSMRRISEKLPWTLQLLQ